MKHFKLGLEKKTKNIVIPEKGCSGMGWSGDITSCLDIVDACWTDMDDGCYHQDTCYYTDYSCNDTNCSDTGTGSGTGSGTGTGSGSSSSSSSR